MIHRSQSNKHHHPVTKVIQTVSNWKIVN